MRSKFQACEHAAWCYRQPYPWIRKIHNHVAFMPGVRIQD
jgi:uncharacterized protein (DUF427 family)